MINTGKNRDIHPNSLKALEAHKWQPGQSGNPTGRPSHKSMAVSLAYIFSFDVPEEDLLERPKLARDQNIQRLRDDGELNLGNLFMYIEVRKALDGDDKAAERIWKYGSGAISGSLEIEHSLNPVDRDFLKWCFDSYEESQAAESDSETQSGLS